MAAQKNIQTDSMDHFIRIMTVLYLSGILLLPAQSSATDAAPEVTIVPQYLSVTTGLSSATVQSIHQDSYGLLWIGTGNGLQRYDGHRFVTYRNVSGNPASLAHNLVWGVMEDAAGTIWVSTERGISRYNRRTRDFVNYDIAEQFGLSGIEAGRIFGIIMDSRDRLWAVGLMAGLLRYNPETDVWGQVDYQSADTVSANTIGEILLGFTEDGEGRFWAGSINHGLIAKQPGGTVFHPVEINEEGRVDFTDPLDRKSVV